jgi:hypothetical protein
LGATGSSGKSRKKLIIAIAITVPLLIVAFATYRVVLNEIELRKPHKVRIEVEGQENRSVAIDKLIRDGVTEDRESLVVVLPWKYEFTAYKGTGVVITARIISNDISGVLVTIYVDGVAVKQGSSVGTDATTSVGGTL